MCSTPFGITDYIGLHARALVGATADPGAQRLSASRIISGSHRSPSTISARCAQRLSASRIISGVPELAGSHGLQVCSTPFGITDYIGVYQSCVIASLVIGAQRLSASRIISAVVVSSAIVTSCMCSTPFGITDYIGPGSATASRHRPGRCAQRLSASRIISASIVASRSSSWRTVCAQRLSASRIISVAVPFARGRRAGWCSTPFGITDYIGRTTPSYSPRWTSVLNAFRHHGLYRPRSSPQTRE